MAWKPLSEHPILVAITALAGVMTILIVSIQLYDRFSSQPQTQDLYIQPADSPVTAQNVEKEIAQTVTETLTTEPQLYGEDADFTHWAPKSVLFSEAPALVKLCRGVPPVSVTVNAVRREIVVNEKPFIAGENRVISDTCKITGYILNESRNWQSGGTLKVMYREKK